MTEPIRIEIPTPFPIGPVNAYLFLEPEPTLVDCGMKTAGAIEAVTTGLAAHGLTVADLKRIVITHAHVDHMGLVQWLCEHSDATVAVSKYVYPWAVDFESRWDGRVRFLSAMMVKMGISAESITQTSGYFKTMAAMWGGVAAERVEEFDLHGTVEMGNADWQVMYLPGHASMQTGFYQPDARWLISADCLLPLTPVPVIEYDPRDNSQRSPGFPLHLESLAKLAALDITCVYPGHGRPIKNHRRLIEKQVERIHVRKEECFELLAGGLTTVAAIGNVMYAHHPEGGRFTGMATVLGYLDLLSAENRVTCQEIDNIWQYRVASN